MTIALNRKYIVIFYRFSVEVSRNNDTPSQKPEQVRGNPGNGAGKGGGEDDDKMESKKKPMYVFTLVDRYGDNKGKTEQLEDLGKKMNVTLRYGDETSTIVFCVMKPFQ